MTLTFDSNITIAVGNVSRKSTIELGGKGIKGEQQHERSHERERAEPGPRANGLVEAYGCFQ